MIDERCSYRIFRLDYTVTKQSFTRNITVNNFKFSTQGKCFFSKLGNLALLFPGIEFINPVDIN